MTVPPSGLLTNMQLEVLKLRLEGLTQHEIAERFGTTRQNVTMIEKRARRNLRLARQTLHAYHRLLAAAIVEITPGTHRVDVPRMVVDAADRAHIKLRANFTRIFDEIHFKAPDCIEGAKITKPLTIFLLKTGDIEVVPCALDPESGNEGRG